MADDPEKVKDNRQHSPSKKAPIVDNFVLLVHNHDSAETDDGDKSPSAEAAFRHDMRDYLDRIEELRGQITDKYRAKQLITVKLEAQLMEYEQQSKFNVCNTKTKNGIKLNYKRMLLLCEKIYTLSVQLQGLYLELADVLEKRVECTMDIHRRSRLCCTALYDYKKKSCGT